MKHAINNKRAGVSARIAVVAALLMVTAGFAVGFWPFGASSAGAAAEAIGQLAAVDSGRATVTTTDLLTNTSTTRTFVVDGTDAALADDRGRASYIVDGAGYIQDQDGWLTAELFDRSYVLDRWEWPLADTAGTEAWFESVGKIDVLEVDGQVSYQFTTLVSDLATAPQFLTSIFGGSESTYSDDSTANIRIATEDGVVTALDYVIAGQQFEDDAVRKTITVTFTDLGEPQSIVAPTGARNHPDQFRLLDGEEKAYLNNIERYITVTDAECAPIDFETAELLAPLTDNRMSELDSMVDCLEDMGEYEAQQSLIKMLERRP